MNIELGVLLAFGAMITWAIGDFLIQRSARKIGNIEALAVIGIVGSIGLLPFVYQDLPLLATTENIILLIVLGIFVFISAILDMEALKEGKLSIIDVIFEIELPVTIALSFIFLKETLSSFQLLLIVIAFIGMIFMATKSFSHWKTKIERGVWIALAAAILMGVVNFLTASSAKHISPLLAIWVPWVLFTMITLIVIWHRNKFKEFRKNIVQFKWLLLWMGVIDTAAWIFYAFAVQNNEVAIITAITECYPALALFLGLWLNKERINWHQYIGVGLALGACVVLSMTL